jgi:flagellin
MASLSLNANTSKESTDIERLSTGLKINSAADDPSGLVTSEDEAAQLSGLNQATSNTGDATNLTQTAEGALNQVQTLLVSMRQLAVAASQTGTNNTAELAADQQQISSAISSINNISSNTQFNNANLLDGSATATGTTTTGSAVLQSAGAGAGESMLSQGSWSATATNQAITVASAVTASETSGVDAAATTDDFTGAITITHSDGSSSVYNVGNAATGGSTGTTSDGTAVDLAGINTALAGSGYTASIDATTKALTVSSTTAGVNTDTVSLTGLTDMGSNGSFTGTQFNTANVTNAATDNMTNGSSVVGAAAVMTVGTMNSTGSTVIGNNTVYNFSNGLTLEAATQTASATAAPTTSATDTGATGSNGYGDLLETAGTTTTGQALQFQIGSNRGQTVSLSIQSTAASQIGTGATYTNSGGQTVATNTQNVAGINVTTQSGAQDAISVIDQAMSQISTIRASLGSFQTNVLQSNATSLGVATTNLQAAQATTEDTDMASTVVSYTKDSILVSAATSALSYANQAPQSILKLLQ